MLPPKRKTRYAGEAELIIPRIVDTEEKRKKREEVRGMRGVRAS